MNPYSHFSSPLFDRFLIWLSTTDLRMFFYQMEAYDGLVRFVHVLSAGTLFGSILLMDLKLIGYVPKLGLRDLADVSIPWAITGLVGAIATGVILLLFDPIAVGVHTYFLPKMALIALGGLNALAFHWLVKLPADGARSLGARISGAASIMLWAGVFLCAALNGAERISSSVASLH